MNSNDGAPANCDSAPASSAAGSSTSATGLASGWAIVAVIGAIIAAALVFVAFQDWVSGGKGTDGQLARALAVFGAGGAAGSLLSLAGSLESSTHWVNLVAKALTTTGVVAAAILTFVEVV